MILPRESCLSKNKAVKMLVLATWKYKIATLLSIVLDNACTWSQTTAASVRYDSPDTNQVSYPLVS